MPSHDSGWTLAGHPTVSFFLPRFLLLHIQSCSPSSPSLSLSKSLSHLEYSVSWSSNSDELAVTRTSHTESNGGKMADSSLVAAQMSMFGQWVASGEDCYILMIDRPSLAFLTTIKGWFLISTLSLSQWCWPFRCSITTHVLKLINNWFKY